MRTDDRVAAVVRKKGWLDECAVTDLTNDLSQKSQSGFKDLVVSDGLGVQIIIICDDASATVSCLEEWRRIRVVSNFLQ